MEREDFTYIVDGYGYMLQYKGHNLGGAGTIRNDRKIHWKHRMANIATYGEDAEREICYILDGRGQERFREIIEQIDKEGR